MYAIDRLRRDPPAEPGVRVVYISPLRALGNDIRRNLEIPLAALGGPRAAIRTGDTTPTDRRRQLRHPPEILITTPESLFILLGSAPGRAMLATTRTAIVDEIHALAGNKRGAHLALTLERLQALAGQPLQRIGLSATQRPLAEVAAFLTGGRPATILEASAMRSLDIRVLSPVADFGDVPGDTIWDSIVPQVLDLVRAHRTTLVFVNNRGLSERLTARLNAAAGEAICRSHHGSTARELREGVEAALKAGTLRSVCATGTLEFGIDIGSVDLVICVEAPGGVARGLQRIGRSGHQVGGTPRGRIVAKHPGDLLEAAVTAAAMAEGDVEPTRVPNAPLDVLAQQVVALAAAGGEVAADDAFALARHAYPYRGLLRASFEAAVRLGVESALIDWDPGDGLLRPRPRAASLVARSGGTIPDRGLYPAIHDGHQVGELDEEFVYESRVGDTFVLGTSSWRIEAIEANRVRVVPGRGGLPRLPFWHGDGLGRPAALGRRIGAFLREAEARGDIEGWLRDAYACDDTAAACLAAYVREQPVLPTDRRVVVETFPDPLGEGLCVIHSVFGARVNAPWAIALGAALRTQSVYTDDGVLLRLPAGRAGGLLRRYPFAVLRRRLEAALLRTPLFAARFRENAARALVLPRLGYRRRTPLWLQRLRAGDLLADALREPDHPLVTETLRECLEDVFDLAAWEDAMRCETVERRLLAPSPLARGLMLRFQAKFFYEGDAPSAERLSADVASGAAAPDATALAEAADRALGRAGTPLELVDLLRRSGGLTDAEVAARSAVGAEALGARVRREGRLWVLAGEPGAQRLVRHLKTSPSVTPAAAASRFDLDLAEAAARLAALAAQGRAVPLPDGSYAAPEILRAGERRIRARMAPVSAGQHAAWVDRHLRGDLASLLDGLQGYPLSVGAWEEQVLCRRVPGFTPSALDRLLAEGQFIAVGERPAFHRRELAERLLPPLPASGPVVDALRRGGALFFSDVCRASGLGGDEALEELLRLLGEGVVTNDSLAPWRLPPGTRAGRAGAGLGGRWSLVPRGAAQPEAWAGVLLQRYGVVARLLWEGPVPWTEGLKSLRAMEAAGRVRRGYFVRGLGGLQFALPAPVEGLRAAVPPSWWWLPACDPANVLQPRREGTYLVLAGERPVIAVAAGQVRELHPVADREAAAACLTELPAPRGRLTLEWPAGEAALAAAGFARRPRGWVYRRDRF